MRRALFYSEEGGRCHCQLCHHGCVIDGGQNGWCGVRRNLGGVLYAESYGQVSSLAMDPIEKKPLRRFYPGSHILSVGSYGCNMNCAFCQNDTISQARPPTETIPPNRLVELAAETPGNIGVAFTYNEPLVGIEYILDTAPLLRRRGLKVVLVTNGMILSEPLETLLPFIDGMNIDVKAFTPVFYRKHGGDLDTVKHTVERAATSCHVEVTTLIIPGENDGAEEMSDLARWLESISPDIPLHLSRFFPRRKMSSTPVTPAMTLYKLKELTEEFLEYVFLGNM